MNLFPGAWALPCHRFHLSGTCRRLRRRRPLQRRLGRSLRFHKNRFGLHLLRQSLEDFHQTHQAQILTAPTSPLHR